MDCTDYEELSIGDNINSTVAHLLPHLDGVPFCHECNKQARDCNVSQPKHAMLKESTASECTRKHQLDGSLRNARLGTLGI